MTTALADRAMLAFTALVMRDECRRDATGYGVTDSDVLDVIYDWAHRPANAEACASDACCDYQRLSALVWAQVEAADSE